MHFRTRFAFPLAHAVALAVFLGSAAAGELPSQTSEREGVSIAVKPLDISAGAARWSFEVSLSTRDRELRDDLARTAYLMNRSANRREKPVEWKADGAGGNLRKGILSFKPLKPMPTAIELRLQRVGEKAPRLFRWDLNCQCGDPKMHAS